MTRKNNIKETGYRKYNFHYDIGYEIFLVKANSGKVDVLPTIEEIQFLKTVLDRNDDNSKYCKFKFEQKYSLGIDVSQDGKTGYYTFQSNLNSEEKDFIRNCLDNQIKLNFIYEKREHRVMRKKVNVSKREFLHLYNRSLAINENRSEQIDELQEIYGEENVKAVRWKRDEQHSKDGKFFNINHGGIIENSLFHYSAFFVNEKKLVDTFYENIFIGSIEEFQNILMKLNNGEKISFEILDRPSNNDLDMLLKK